MLVFRKILRTYQRRTWTAATSMMERFMIVNSFQALTIITKRSILDVRAVLDPPLLRAATLSKRDSGTGVFL